MAKKQKQTKNNNTTDIALLVSGVLAFIFLYSVLVLVRSAKMDGAQGAPNSFAAWPSLALASYAFAAIDKPSRKYVSIAVIAVLATGFLVWLLGTTGAGSIL
jgi:hypothetical protein